MGPRETYVVEPPVQLAADEQHRLRNRGYGRVQVCNVTTRTAHRASPGADGL